jgi:hypothetical protein
MSYFPQRVFNGIEGQPSRDTMGPEVLSADIDKLIKMFNPAAVHDDGSQGGISEENLNFQLIADLIGIDQIQGLLADTVQAALAEILEKLDDHKSDFNNPHQVTSAQIVSVLFGTVEAGLTELASRIETEIQTRIAAIATETQARIAGDNATRALIEAEAAARASADGVLQTHIDEEELARKEADGTLGNRIDAEAVARAVGDENLRGALEVEALTRAAADGSISGNVSDVRADLDMWMQMFGTRTWQEVLDTCATWQDVLNFGTWMKVYLKA